MSDIKQFCEHELKKTNSRDDYKEFLELILLFLGGNNYNLRQPGATHHARWMGKALYALKIYLCRESFRLTSSEEKGLREICIFLVRLYVKAWFRCTIGVEAANNDLNFLKDSVAYSEIDRDISKIVLKKICNHLWYLSEETIALSFFDKHVSTEVKRKMAEALKKNGNREGCKRVIVSATEIQESYQSKDLSSFITLNTLKFFHRFGISTDFLQNDPNTWTHRDDYKAAVDLCYKMKVVNDTAERAVKLMTEFNEILTNNEQDKQFLLQVVIDYR